MKKSRFSESQIVAVLEEVDAGRAVAKVIRRHGISQATYYAWKSKYGGSEASDLKRLREMERQLCEYKTMVAELSHENRALKGLIEKKL